MRKRAGGGRPRTLTGRLLLWQAIAVLGVLVALPLTIVGSTFDGWDGMIGAASLFLNPLA